LHYNAQQIRQLPPGQPPMPKNTPADAPAVLTVRDAAERLNVTPRTLKYYEERGLIKPTRSEGRYRLYDEQDLEQFARILRLRSLGFSLHGIAEMLKRPLESAGDGRRRYSQESLQHIADALNQQIETLDARIAAVRRELKEAQTVRAELADDLDYLNQRLAGVPSETLIDERLAARKKRRTIPATQDDHGASQDGDTQA
jgi:MerR family transcriptional regulator, repressor of the yfmOP operon